MDSFAFVFRLNVCQPRSDPFSADRVVPLPDLSIALQLVHVVALVLVSLLDGQIHEFLHHRFVMTLSEGLQGGPHLAFLDNFFPN